MSYRNPVTYVDSQSGKYFASAIQNISNTTAGVIDTLGAKAEAERKKKEEENFKLLNDVTKYNLDYLNNANLASKDFDIQPALQPALSGLVDQGARIKAQLLNSKNPAERAQLQSQLTQYETFFKGGGMKNLLESFQEKRELFSKIGGVGKAGAEGGIDMKKLDPRLAKFFMSTYNDTLPSDLGINIVNNNGVFDIVLNSTGGQFGKENGYQQSLMALMSAELPVIPGITAESNATLIQDKLIDKNGVADFKGQATAYLTAGKVIDFGGRAIQTYDFNDNNRAEFRKNMEKNVLATLAGYSNEGSLMDGPGTGFNSIESYYNNVLRKEGDPELEIGNAEGTSLSEKSLEIVKNKMLDKMEEKFENSIPRDMFSKTAPKGNGKNKNLEYDASAKSWWENYKKDPAAAYTSNTGENAKFDQKTNTLTTYSENENGDISETEYDLNIPAVEEFVVKQLLKTDDQTLGNTEDDRAVKSRVIEFQRTQEKPKPETFEASKEQVGAITTQLIKDIKESKSDVNVVTNISGTKLKINDKYDLTKIKETLNQIKTKYPSFKGTDAELLNTFLILAKKQYGENDENYKELAALYKRLK